MIRDINSTTVKMSQPFLICQILEFFLLDENKTKGQDDPVGKPLLIRDLNGVERKYTWLYQGGVGMPRNVANGV